MRNKAYKRRSGKKGKQVKKEVRKQGNKGTKEHEDKGEMEEK